ncbi:MULTISPECIES: SurA N-terminal domain-containing protein [unclassified Bosea (in: a-proteobacteria)]|uniref:SurA N-terminal domain-containing protein n=1 Tax=unclassified Bosea (in: a-proteobacteria) TaxID=2653178 RepID=UPI001F170173|nr:MULTISPECIES: SurA N-terminal domain-containing protein [unclassified Bosea (in: a-proteobacteria)]
MMMQGIRKAGQSLIGKLIIAVMFGFLIISFAIWGIGDIFRGYGRNAVAVVGKTEISIEQLRTAYQNEVQQLTRQQRRQISPELARALGLDQRVLSRLVTDATLDQTATKLGLAVSDETVRNILFNDPNLKNAAGQFDPNRFNELLRAMGLNEQGFVREQRAATMRQELAEMVVGAVTAPGALQELGHRLRHEKREIAYVTLPDSAAGEIPAPTEDALRKYFDERKAAFRAPEYRTANVLVLTAANLADPAKVSDADARARYEQIKAQRFGSAERRIVQQIGFPSIEEARAAKAKIDAGETFEAVGASRNIAAADLTLGTFTREGLFDPAVRDAAFALAQGAVSEPVQGGFGIVLLRVPTIEPARLKSFEEVADEVRRDVATSRAAEQMTELHDKIEDQRASAKPLAEIAKEFGLALRSFGPANSSLGKADGTQETALPGGDATQQAIFRSDIGVDNEATRLPNNGGYVWFDLSKIDPPRERSFDEVKAEVEKQWRADEVATRLSARAREIVQKLDAGEKLDAIAFAQGFAFEEATLGRQDQSDALPRNVVSLVFGTPAGKASSAAVENAGRVVFQVKAATVTPYVRTAEEAENFVRLLSSSISEDILAQYVGKLQNDLGVQVNQAALRNATGGQN